MIEYLLMHGYVIFEQVKVVENNIYQNVFREEKVREVRAIRDGIDLPLEEVFRKHIKKKILNQI